MDFAPPEASAGSTEPQEEDDDAALEAAKDKRWAHARARPQGQQTKNAAVPCFTGGNTYYHDYCSFTCPLPTGR